MFGLEVTGHGQVRSRAAGLQWLGLIRSGKFADAYPHQLSGGMKQRRPPSCGRSHQPRILLMDEPSARSMRRRARACGTSLGNLAQARHHHHLHHARLEEAIFLADRILVAVGAYRAKCRN